MAVDTTAGSGQNRTMLGEIKDQFSLTRAALSTGGRARSDHLSVSVSCTLGAAQTKSMSTTERPSFPTDGHSTKRGPLPTSRLTVTGGGPMRGGGPFVTRRNLWWVAAGLGLLGLLTP